MAAISPPGIAGMVFTSILLLYPLIAMVDIIKKKTADGYSELPYVATFFNCGLWLISFLPMISPHGNLPLLVLNAVGLGLQAVYIVIYIIFSNNHARKRVAIYMGLGISIVALILVPLLNLEHSTRVRSLAMGYLCATFNSLMYLSPAPEVYTVITTSSSENLPFFPPLMTFTTGICWCLYAHYNHNNFILVANGIGAVSGIFQLALHLFYFTRQILEASGLSQE